MSTVERVGDIDPGDKTDARIDWGALAKCGRETVGLSVARRK